jgi:hypothetical protein
MITKVPLDCGRVLFTGYLLIKVADMQSTLETKVALTVVQGQRFDGKKQYPSTALDAQYTRSYEAAFSRTTVSPPLGVKN